MKKYVKQTLIVAMMTALAALVLTACGGTKLNVKDYTEVTFSGAEGYGRASVSLNEDQMLAVPTSLTKEYTVSDLPEGGTLDLFEDLQVTVSGFAPTAKSASAANTTWIMNAARPTVCPTAIPLPSRQRPRTT